jgi:5'-nucleotidase
MLQKLSKGAHTTISVIAGDFLSPSVLSSLDSGKGMIDCLNRIPISHACFGNHEADVGIPELKRRIDEFGGKWLNSNMKGFKHPKLHEYDIVSTACGRRVALIGLLLDGKVGLKVGDFKGIKVDPVLPAATELCSRLRSTEKVDLIVPITHQSFREDSRLAQAGLGFPLIIGGHDHEVRARDTAARRLSHCSVMISRVG